MAKNPRYSSDPETGAAADPHPGGMAEPAADRGRGPTARTSPAPIWSQAPSGDRPTPPADYGAATGAPDQTGRLEAEVADLQGQAPPARRRVRQLPEARRQGAGRAVRAGPGRVHHPAPGRARRPGPPGRERARRPPTRASLRDALLLVDKKLRKELEAAGVERIDPAGEPFDPSQHEAVSTVPTPDASRDHTVSATFQSGYRFKGQLVRPARVQVFSSQGAG